MSFDEDAVLEREVRSPAVSFAITRGWFHARIQVAKPNGIPDDYFLRNGRSVWIEFKRPGELPRPQQLLRHKQIHIHGGEVHVVDNLDDAKRILR